MGLSVTAVSAAVGAAPEGAAPVLQETKQNIFLSNTCTLVSLLQSLTKVLVLCIMSLYMLVVERIRLFQCDADKIRKKNKQHENLIYSKTK